MGDYDVNEFRHILQYYIGMAVFRHIYDAYMSSPQTAELASVPLAQSQEAHYFDREFAEIEAHYEDV